MAHIVGITCQNVDDTIVEHFFRPIASPATKPAQQRAGCDLHPYARMRHLANGTIMAVDPGKSFRMRKDWHIAGTLKVKKTFIEPCWCDMMRCFHQHIAGIGQGEQVPALQALDEIGRDVHIGAGDQIEADAALVEFLLQGGDPLANIRAAIWPDAGKNMRCAGHHANAVGYSRPRHIQRNIEVGCAIIYSRQQMRVQINHRHYFRL